MPSLPQGPKRPPDGGSSMTTGKKPDGKKSRAWLKEMQSGQRAFQQRKLQKAIRSFSNATRLQPGEMAGWANLGSALLEAGEYHDSHKALDRAITLAPIVMTPHMLLGDVLRHMGRVEESFAAYERAVDLERSPLSLNKLACALRSMSQMDRARALYLEAIRMDPRFTLARVNFATLQLGCNEIDGAESRLKELQMMQLPAAERQEVGKAILSVGEYRRLEPAIERMNSHGDLAPLESLLRDLPPDLRKIDQQVLARSHAYLQAVQRQPLPESLPLIPLPDNWPLIEGLFMIPLINSVTELQQFDLQVVQSEAPEGELLESLNVRDAVLAARLARDTLTDPVKMELHLRHWHGLSAKGLAGFSPGFSPGHLKYTQNWAAKSPTLKRVEPAFASATLQCFLRDIYPALPAGLARAAVCFLAICDLHCFADGNGRVALTWINRLLEWHGEMPLLFTRELGMRGELGEAKRIARDNGGDPSPVIAVMQSAQQFARGFCEELADQLGQ